jgi:hypothetical protein
MKFDCVPEASGVQLLGPKESVPSGLSDRNFGPKMFFGRVASLVMSHAAVVGVFAEIPIVSNYAFWVLVGAYLLWIGVSRRESKKGFKLQTSCSLCYPFC